MVRRHNAGSRGKLIQPKAIQRPNREKGYYLVEALVCVLIVGIISAGLADGYAKIKAFNTHSQTELQAIGIAQECIDQLRAQPFTSVQGGLGNHAIPLIGTSPTGDPIFPRPLLRDTTLTYYNGGGIVGQSGTQVIVNANDTQNYLRCVGGVCNISLAAGAILNTVDITVSLTWNDGTGTHNYTVNTTLTAQGLNG